jgi:hypothetical protein
MGPEPLKANDQIGLSTNLPYAMNAQTPATTSQ